MKKRNAILIASAAAILSISTIGIVFSKLKTNHNSVSAENLQQNDDNLTNEQKEVLDVTSAPISQEDENKERSGFAEIFLEHGEDLTSEQIEILENMPELEKKYLEAGLNAPVDPNFKKSN